MKFLLNIHCDNAAFHGEDCEGDKGPLPPNTLCECAELQESVASTLEKVAQRVRGGDLDGYYHTILDTNGNNVGSFAGKPDSYQP